MQFALQAIKHVKEEEEKKEEKSVEVISGSVCCLCNICGLENDVFFTGKLCFLAGAVCVKVEVAIVGSLERNPSQ